MNLEIACMTLGNLLCWGCQSVSCVSVLYENRKFAARFSKNRGFVKPWVCKRQREYFALTQLSSLMFSIVFDSPDCMKIH